MSNVGQAVLTIGGAIIGNIIAPGIGAAIGTTLGSIVGGALFPTDLGTIKGPRLQDLTVQSSTVGAPIPVLYGRFAFSGNLIWSAGIKEKVTKKRQGGKGGPTQTTKTYSYSVDCAVGLCEGEINCITRIWADAKLIYDVRPQMDGESAEDYAARITAGVEFLNTCAIYTGTETQERDPTIESYEGELVSAFRGLAYVVFNDFQLEDYGNRIPNFRFEVQRIVSAAEDVIHVGRVCGKDLLPPYEWTADLSPFGLVDGDLLMLHLYVVGNPGVTAPGYCVEFDDWQVVVNGWVNLTPYVRAFAGAANSRSREVGSQAFAYRFWNGGEAQVLHFVLPSQYSICIEVIRGAHRTDPFPYVAVWPGFTTSGDTANLAMSPPNPIPYFENMPGSLRLDLTWLGNNGDVSLLDDAMVWPDTDDVVYSGYLTLPSVAEGVIEGGSMTFYTLRKLVPGEAQNLIEYSDFNFAPIASGWTLHNCTYSESVLTGLHSNRFTFDSQITDDVREIRYAFTAQAGRKYCFWVLADQYAISRTMGYLRAGTFHGFGGDRTHTVKEGTDDVAISGVTMAFGPGNEQIQNADLHCFWFSFDQDTDIELLFGQTSSLDDYARVRTSTFTTSFFTIHAVGISEVPSFGHVPALVENTTGAPLTGVNMTHAANPQFYSEFPGDPNVSFSASNPRMAWSLLVRSKTDPAPTIDLRAMQALPHNFSHDDAQTFEQYRLTARGWSNARKNDPASVFADCPRPAMKGIGHNKLYCEYEYIACQGYSTNYYDPWVYVTTYGDRIDSGGGSYAIAPRNLSALEDGHWIWSSRGYMWDGPTAQGYNVNHVASPGKVMGVGVDFDAGWVRWYLDGVLIDAAPFDADRDKRWLMTGVAFGDGSRSALIHNPKIKANWTGPFKYPQEGYEPWDWANPDGVPLNAAGCSDEPMTLSGVVYDICIRAGLEDAQINVSGLTEEIDGYLIGRVMSARDAIEPLRTFGWFDCAESEGVLRWPLRGGAAVAALEADDLGAHLAGEARPAAVTTARRQENEIPRVMRVHYAQTDHNYEPGEQIASRISVASEEIRDIELPIAMSGTKAAQIAEVVLYDSWAGRNSYQFALDQSWLALDPADPITLPVDGRQERVRITGIEHALPGLLRIEALRDDDGVYVSYAIGSAVAYSDSTGGASSVVIPGTADLVLLDLPLLRDSDNDAGYYAAVQAVGSTSFGGAALYRSADGGTTYDEVAIMPIEATIGSLVDALPAGPTTIIDEGSQLIVTTDDELESITEATLLAGGNAAAIGADDRWEVIQFRDAEPYGSPQTGWVLTGLLRGRRGTEWAVGTSQAADKFVLLDAGVVRVPMNVGAIGASRLHKVVLSGTSIDAASPVSFAGEGVALEPFSGVHVAGERDAGDLTITWIRRDRLGQELPSGTDIPMSESSESYEVDILDGATVVRTLTASSPSVTYTAAQQTADFGSPQASISVEIYQLSALVGRGYAAEATV